jgi:hypothetical protein
MRRWAHLSIFLLAAAYAVAGLPWLVAHGLLHHAHEEEPHAVAGQHEHGVAHCPEEAAAVATLVHGHAHPDGVPEHAHGVSPTVSFRHDPPDLERPTDSGPFRLTSPDVPDRPFFERVRSDFVAGAGPPARPYSLCVLLI